jgi:hypothetical protein
MEYTMVWAEATRRQYRRNGLRYASNLTDVEWALIKPFMPAARRIGRPLTTCLSAAVAGHPLSRLDWLRVAPAAQGVSTLFDGPVLFLRLITRRHLRADQPRSRGRPAREDRTRGQLLRGRDRQPVGQDSGSRRPARP